MISTNVIADMVGAITGGTSDIAKLGIKIIEAPFDIRNKFFWDNFEYFIDNVYLTNEEKEKLARLEDTSAATLLTQEEIPGTTQRYTFEEDGTIKKIEHVQNGQAIRTDTFTFGENVITEVRTASTGETLTIVTNTETMETTTTYTEGLTDGN